MALQDVSRKNAQNLIQHLDADIGLLDGQVKHNFVPLEDAMEGWVTVKMNARDLQVRLEKFMCDNEDLTLQDDVELICNLRTMKALDKRLLKVASDISCLSRVQDLHMIHLTVWVILFLAGCTLIFFAIELDILTLVENNKNWARWVQLICFIALLLALLMARSWTAIYERCKDLTVSQQEPLLPLLCNSETGQKDKRFRAWRHSVPAFHPTSDCQDCEGDTNEQVGHKDLASMELQSAYTAQFVLPQQGNARTPSQQISLPLLPLQRLTSEQLADMQDQKSDKPQQQDPIVL